MNGIRRLDGTLLLVFRELCRRPQTTEAARRLGLSQSAVSHALGRLRDVFGDPLFIRRPHGLEPTRRALELAPRIDALIDLVNATLGPREAFDPTLSERRFTMAASQSLVVLLGAGLFDRLQTIAPNTACLVRDLAGDEALDAVRRGEIDVALGRFGALPPDLVAQTLFEDRYCVVVRQGHPQVNGTIDAATYAQLGHVFAGPSGRQGAVEDPMPAAGAVGTVVVAPLWLTALWLVAESDAIATVPRRIAERMANAFGLRVLDPPFEPWRFQISLVRRAPGVDAGCDWFVGELRRALGADAGPAPPSARQPLRKKA